MFNSQYGFWKKHSCEHLVTELVGEICKGLEQNKHTISLFIDMSKAFDTISYNILLRKLKRYGIRGIALNWFTSYLTNWELRAKCTTAEQSKPEYSDTKLIKIGTLQGSCLGPLIFLLFCNDLYLNLDLCKGILFADDTTIYNSHHNLRYLKWTVEHDLSILLDWFKANQLSMNSTKSMGMLFSNNKKLKLDEITINDTSIKMVSHTKFLGIWIDKNLTWHEHISRVHQKIQKNLHLFRAGKNFLDIHSKRLLYFAQIQSHLNYGLALWGNMSSTTLLNKLQKVQNKCINIITGKQVSQHCYKEPSILRIRELLELENCKLDYKLLHQELPIRIEDLSNHDQFGKTLQKKHKYKTHNRQLLNKALAKNKSYKNYIIYKGTSALETLKFETMSKPNLQSFTKDCKNRILKQIT